MQCIEKTIARISSAFVRELIHRKTKCNNREFCIMGKHSDGTAAAKRLRLDDTDHYNNVNSSMEVADVFHKLED